jgi:hypothetical protein
LRGGKLPGRPGPVAAGRRAARRATAPPDAPRPGITAVVVRADGRVFTGGLHFRRVTW